MSFPGIIRRLFANEGAGPLLRKEIIPFIPFGTTTGTVCEGDDSRLADWAEVRAALKKELALLQAQRLQSIGVPKFWTSTELPDSDHCWPDGSLVLFADRPEFKAKYDAGGFAGMLLPAGSSNETIAANLGKWVEHPKGLGLYAPQLGEQFFRAWTGAGGTPGAHHDAGLPNITGFLETATTTGQERATGCFVQRVVTQGAYLSATVSQMAAYPMDITLTAQAVNAIYGRSTTVMPASVDLPVITYLGLRA